MIASAPISRDPIHRGAVSGGTSSGDYTLRDYTLRDYALRARTLRRRLAVRRGRPVRTLRVSARRSRSGKLLFSATLLFVAAALSAVAGTLAGHRGEPYAELAVFQLFAGGVLFARANHAQRSA